MVRERARRLGRNATIARRDRYAKELVFNGQIEGAGPRRRPYNQPLRGGGGGEGAGVDFAQNGAKGRGEFFAADVAFAELDAHLKRLVVGLVVEDVGLRTRRDAGFFLAGAARFVARHAALDDFVHHLVHFLFAGLARHLQQQRLRDDAPLDASFPNFVGNDAQRHGFRDGRPRAADFLGDVVVRVVELVGQALQAVGFLERRQVLALQILDQRQFERFRVVGNLLDAGQLVQAGNLRGVVATLAGDDVVGILARDVANEQRLEHALLADGVGQFAHVADILSRLVGIGPNLVDRDHAPHGRAAETG